MAAPLTRDNIASLQADLAELQKQQSSRRRAPPPSLASLDSLNPFRPTSASNRSTPRLSPSSPSFLTPPILDIPHSSPPPQVEGQDYLAVQPRAAQPTKRRHRRSKRPSTSPGVAQNGPEAFHPTNKDGDASDNESSYARVTPSLVTSLFKASIDPDPAELFMIRRQSTKASLAPTTTHKSARGDLTATSHVKMEAEADSIAVSSLRRMSIATKRFSVSKAHDFRRFSHALAAPFHSSSTQDQHFGPTTAADAERVLSCGISQTDVNDFLHKTDTQPLLRHDSRSQPGRVALETPSTITLRKASDAYFIMIGPKDEKLSAKFEPSPQPARPLPVGLEPPSSLLDFRSKRICEPRKPSMWYSLPLLSEQDLSKPPNESPNESSNSDITITPFEHPKPRKPSLATFQPRTQPSEPALTFSSVHRTTPTCMLDPPIHRVSLSKAPKRQRTSTIQIQTRTSVHEIIWAEEADENGNTSDSSESPTQGLSRKPSITAGNITPKVLVLPEPVACTGDWKPMPLVASPKETMAEWSWDARPTRPLLSGMIDDPIVCSPVDEFLPAAPAQKRPSKSKDSSVESFPPLLERNNTTEWRLAPLVDINEPLNGKGRWVPVVRPMAEEGSRDEIPVIEGLDDDDGPISPRRHIGGSVGKNDERVAGEERGGGDERGRRESRRKSTFPKGPEPVRMAERGRVGSHVGISGGKRVSWTRG